MTFQVRAML